MIEISAKNIRKYHEAQMPEEMWFTQIDNGILAGEKITPITSAGLYVPRGKGAFPSADGGADDATLFSAEVCGIKNVYKVGGAQAIAAMAYGTDTIPKVNKDVGTPAGPIESIILCDETVDPAIAALDLLIEAEHGPDSCALLVTHSKELAAQVEALLPDLINDLPEERQNFCNIVLSDRIKDVAQKLAEYEGFASHANAIAKL